MYQIMRREAFSDASFLWEVLSPDVAASAEPGHFVMLRLREGGERIPLTVADFDRARGTITLVTQALGKTTREMRDRYKDGDSFLDFVGPLGLPQHVEKVGHVVLVGAGSASHRCIRSCVRSSRRAIASPGSSGSGTRTWCSGKTGSGRIAIT
jgi:glutamate synthase (NADPH/NADH) small chain